MKNETKNRIIIIMSIIIIVFIIIIILGLLNQCGTYQEYRRLLDNNRELDSKLSNLDKQYKQKNNEITRIESEFEEYRISTETAISKLSKNLKEAGEIISRLENDTISIQSTVNGVSEATDGIREILSEITEME